MQLLNRIQHKKLFNKSFYIFLLLILFSAVSLYGVIHKGFFVSDDGNWMIIRFSAFYEALRSGQFPVRFLPRLNNGWGYPVADFLYPLFMYLGIPIHLVGISFSNTVKVVFALSLLFSGIFSFLWLKRLFSQTSAFFGSLVYLYFPYHLWDVYKRGSIGEVLALAIVPLILWLVEEKRFIFSGIALSFLILSHNVLALLFLPVIIVYLVIRKVSAVTILSFLLIGLGCSAFFWIPALYDQQFTVFKTIKVSDFSTYFLTNVMLIGVLTPVIILGSAVAIFFKKNLLSLFFFLLALVSLIMTFPVTKGLWQILPTQFIQFPFRLLSVTALAISFLAALVVSSFKKFEIILGVFLLILLIFSSYSLLFPKQYQYFPDSFYSTNQDTTTVKNEYMPVWVRSQKSEVRSQNMSIIEGQGTITDLSSRGTRISSSVNFTRPTRMYVNIVYFPGWKVFVDGKQAEIHYNNPYGLMEITVPFGVHNIQVLFQETPIRVFADCITVVTILISGLLLLKKKLQ